MYYGKVHYLGTQLETKDVYISNSRHKKYKVNDEYNGIYNKTEIFLEALMFHGGGEHRYNFKANIPLEERHKSREYYYGSIPSTYDSFASTTNGLLKDLIKYAWKVRETKNMGSTIINAFRDVLDD